MGKLLTPKERRDAWRLASDNNTALVELNYLDVLLLAQDDKEKEAFGLSVQEAAWTQATKEERERILREALDTSGDNVHKGIDNRYFRLLTIRIDEEEYQILKGGNSE